MWCSEYMPSRAALFAASNEDNGRGGGSPSASVEAQPNAIQTTSFRKSPNTNLTLFRSERLSLRVGSDTYHVR